MSGEPPAPSPHPAAKAKAKAKALEAKAKANPGLLRARVAKCQWCHQKRLGWRDTSLVFYCELCWGEYDALEAADGEEYAGREWHDEILEADNQAAEIDDVDSGEVMEAMQRAFQKIDHDEASDADDDIDDDEVGELDAAFKKGGKPGEPPEIQQAHVILVVDISGSMRTVDVQPDEGGEFITRMAAVTMTLRTFFEKQAQGCKLLDVDCVVDVVVELRFLLFHWARQAALPSPASSALHVLWKQCPNAPRHAFDFSPHVSAIPRNSRTKQLNS